MCLIVLAEQTRISNKQTMWSSRNLCNVDVQSGSGWNTKTWRAEGKNSTPKIFKPSFWIHSYFMEERKSIPAMIHALNFMQQCFIRSQHKFANLHPCRQSNSVAESKAWICEENGSPMQKICVRLGARKIHFHFNISFIHGGKAHKFHSDPEL